MTGVDRWFLVVLLFEGLEGSAKPLPACGLLPFGSLMVTDSNVRSVELGHHTRRLETDGWHLRG